MLKLKKLIIVFSVLILCGVFLFILIKNTALKDTKLKQPTLPVQMLEENYISNTRRLYRDEAMKFQFTYAEKIDGKHVMTPVPSERDPSRFDLFESEWNRVSFSLVHLTSNQEPLTVGIGGVYPCEGYFYSIEQNEWHEYACEPPYKAVGPIETLSWDELFSYLENNASKSALPIIETESGHVAFPYIILSYGGGGSGYRVFDPDRFLFFDINYFHADYNSPEFIKEKGAIEEFLQATVRTVNFFQCVR